MIKDKIIIASKKQPNLSISTLYWRMKRYGTPYKPRDGRTKHMLDGRPAVELAMENGISYDLFYSRLKSGWTSYRAATQPPRVRKK